ncbi:MAG TPA: MarR family transcriptional regulator [Sphingomonas sp.]|nr:MarR family transcriptional regulator [Sphingomonas sp.]
MADEVEREADVGVLSALVGYHLRRATNVVAADFARSLSETGVRQVLFGVLSVVERNPGINQGSVGRSLGIQRANMVALVNELVERGLVDRRVSAEDRRAFALSLTDEGKCAYADCLARIRAHEDSVLGDLDTRERKRLIALLSRIEAKES